MYSLPKEQDKLLKEMGDLDNLERLGISPLRNNLNLFIIILIWSIALTLGILNLFEFREDNFLFLILPVLFLSFFLLLAYYNIRIGFFLVSIGAFFINIGVSYLMNFELNLISALVDGIFIFIISTQFTRQGFIAGIILIFLKSVPALINFDFVSNIEVLFAHFVISFCIGFIPVIMDSTSKVSIRAKKAEIRAQILALQNQDLIGSWGSMFSTQTQNNQQNSGSNFQNNNSQVYNPTAQNL
jgi:hypothetical protein